MKRNRRILARTQRLSDPRDVVEYRYLSDVAGQRLQAIRDGGDELLNEEDFWARAERIVLRTK